MIAFNKAMAYAVLLSAVCSGTVYYAVTPSPDDIAKLVQQAQVNALRECTTDTDRDIKKGRFHNSRGQGF